MLRASAPGANPQQQKRSDGRLKDLAAAAVVFAATAVLYGALFNKENALSYSIGYNLYAAERILSGEIPYRDFHTLYPPATVYLNAAIFDWIGVSLYNALLGVLIFKTFTMLTIYLCGRRIMPRTWALGAAFSSLLWLRPNGGFKAVPMHYGALLLALALYQILGFLRDRRRGSLAAAGVAIGALALFKHNIAAYALLGFIFVVLFDGGRARLRNVYSREKLVNVLIMIGGVLAPLLPVMVYLQAAHALSAMIRTLLFGPGEFLVSRLASTPSPLAALAFCAWLALCCYAAARLRSQPVIALTMAGVALASAGGGALFASQAAIDSLIFFLPAFVLAAGLAHALFDKELDGESRQKSLAVLAATAAAMLEVFPRFAREQSIGAMPFVLLAAFFVCFLLKPRAVRTVGPGFRAKAALALLPLVLLLIGARMFLSTYFDGRLRLRSDTELRSERGRHVYFPQAKANEIDEVVSFIDERVPAGGYFFAQSYAGSSFLFLAERENPSGAQFWGGVGVRDSERAETLRVLQEKQIDLVVTSVKDLAAEKYAPMRDYIAQNFETTRETGEFIILERRTSAPTQP